MSQRGSNFQGRRRAAGGIAARFFWLFAGFGAVTAAGVAATAMASVVKLPATAGFVGELTSVSEPQILDLPVGVTPLSVPVQAGTKVSAGDVLAVLDPASIALAIAHAEAAIASDLRLSNCLMALARPLVATIALTEDPAVQPLWAGGTAVHHVDQIDCTVALAADLKEMAALESELSQIDQRIALVSRRIDFAFLNAKKGGADRTEQAQTVLGLAWARTAMDTMRAALLQRRAERAAIIAQQTATRLRKIAADVAENQSALEALIRLGSEPRVLSPIDGTVVRTYRVPSDLSSDGPVPLISLIPHDPGQFEVVLALPDGLGDTLSEGTSVKIAVVGAALSWPVLIGHVSSISHAPAADDVTRTRSARIELTAESAVALEAMGARSAFIRAGAVLEVRAELPETGFREAVSNAFAGLLPRPQAVTIGQPAPSVVSDAPIMRPASAL